MLSLSRRTLAAGLVSLALAAPAAAVAADPNRQFAGSEMIVRDRISVEVVGKGPDVVLIPGLSSSRATWKGEAERLRRTHRVHLVQVAGFAGEPARANAEGEVLIPTAEAVGAYIEERKLAPVVVVGHSLGGTMGLHLAQQRPELVKKLMAVDSMPFLAQVMVGPNVSVESARPLAAMIRDGMAKGGESYMNGLKMQIARMAVSEADRNMILGWGRVTDPSVAARAFYEGILLDLRPGLAGLKAPLTVVHPDNAPAGLQPGQMAGYYKAAYAAVPAVTLRPVEQSLHFVMLDQPQAFAAALDAFLSEP